jgi:hypothetical protein
MLLTNVQAAAAALLRQYACSLPFNCHGGSVQVQASGLLRQQPRSLRQQRLQQQVVLETKRHKTCCNMGAKAAS